MPDLKISQLADGGAIQGSDQVPVNRSGANFRVTVAGLAGAIDILWSDLLTAIGGSALVPFAWYHITSPPDGSSTISEAWAQAKDENEMFPDGMCIINAANITDRLASIRWNFLGGVGGKITGVYDNQGNVVEAIAPFPADTSGTPIIDRWLTIFLSTNKNIKVYGSTLGAGASGVITDNSVFMPGSSLALNGASAFAGYLGPGATGNLDNGSNANTVNVLGGIQLDAGTTMANTTVGLGKTLTVADGGTYIGFSTEENLLVQRAGNNASGDTVNVDVNTGTLIIADGNTDITINMPIGLIDGQRMTIIFLILQAATTWGGGITDSTFFPATSPSGYKIEAVWDATSITWR